MKSTLANVITVTLCMGGGSLAYAQPLKVDTSKTVPKFSSDSTMGTHSSFSGTTYAPTSRPFATETVPSSFSQERSGLETVTHPPVAHTAQDKSFVSEGAHKSFRSDAHASGINGRFMSGSAANSHFQNGTTAGSQFSKGATAPTSGLGSSVEYARAADGTYRPKSSAASTTEATPKSAR